MNDSTIQLTRDILAVRIPNGEQITLPKETPIVITQALGGSFTVVIPTQPGLYRIDAEYADALGRDKPAVEPVTQTGPVTEAAVWEVLKTCYDPEIPINIVDLGLIYSLELAPTADGQGTTVSAQMTLTAAGCGMGPVIAGEARTKIAQIPGVISADVQVVWTPAWSPDRISEEGKKKLGML